MPSAMDEAVIDAPENPKSEEPPICVEVVEGTLCSSAELQRAVVTGAIVSGLVCTLAGLTVGYLLGHRDGREWR